MIQRLFSWWRGLDYTVIDALNEFADRHNGAFDIFEKGKIYADALEYLKDAVPNTEKHRLYLIEYHKMAGKQTANIINPN